MVGIVRYAYLKFKGVPPEVECTDPVLNRSTLLPILKLPLLPPPGKGGT